MAIYNRVRILIVGSRRFERDSDAARAEYDPIMEPLGARYIGFGISGHGHSRCHVYMIDDPTDEQLTSLLLLDMTTLPLEIIREYHDDNAVAYTVAEIVRDIARTLTPNILSGPKGDQMATARCWSGVKVMEGLISKLSEKLEHQNGC